jgi:AcrR family transcriptional regulator
MPVRQPRKRMHPTVRAEHILNVALQLFAERHYGTVSVRDIADACDINAALIYYYYPNKDELLRRALGHAIAELQAGYDLGEHLNPAQELTAWLRMHVPIAPMLLRMVKIMADYAASNIRDDNTDRMIQNFYAGEQNFLENCLRRGIALGVFRPVEVTAAARAVSLQLDGIFYASQARGDSRIELDIENLCNIVASQALAATP